jgi:hypothetical protein
MGQTCSVSGKLLGPGGDPNGDAGGEIIEKGRGAGYGNINAIRPCSSAMPRAITRSSNDASITAQEAGASFVASQRSARIAAIPDGTLRAGAE